MGVTYFFVLLEKVHIDLYFTATLFWLDILDYKCKEFGRWESFILYICSNSGV